MKLLIVEDNVAQVESLELIFKMEGHTVYRALNALSAREILEVHSADAIVLDLVMPGVDEAGGNLVTWLRSTRPETAEVPVVLTTGMDLDDIPEDILRQPRVSAIQKPFTIDSLMCSLQGLGVDTRSFKIEG
jgi:CheY-like chemotaxis protein